MRAVKLAVVAAVALALTGCSLSQGLAGTDVRTIQTGVGHEVVCVIVGGSSGSNAVSCDWEHAK